MSNVSNATLSKTNVKELKQFALLMTWAMPLFFGVIAPLIIGKSVQWWTLLFSVFFMLMYWLAPKQIYYPYRVWMFIGGILGFINTRIILGLTFYLLIFPIGLLLKIFKKLQYKHRCTSGSNYVQRTDKIAKQQLEQPF